MKVIVFFALLAFALAIPESYLFDDDEDFRNIVACLVGKKSCEKDDALLESAIKGVLQDGCAVCDDVEKEMFNAFFESFKLYAPEDWEVFETMYDPDGELWKAFQENVKN